MSDLIVTAGKNLLLHRMFATDESKVSVFEVGTSTTSPSASDTALGAEVYGPSSFLSGYPLFDTGANTVIVGAYLTISEANGNTLGEFGLFNTDSSPVMFARSTYSTVDKTNQDEVSYTYTFSY